MTFIYLFTDVEIYLLNLRLNRQRLFWWRPPLLPVQHSRFNIFYLVHFSKEAHYHLLVAQLGLFCRK